MYIQILINLYEILLLVFPLDLIFFQKIVKQIMPPS